VEIAGPDGYPFPSFSALTLSVGSQEWHPAFCKPGIQIISGAWPKS